MTDTIVTSGTSAVSSGDSGKNATTDGKPPESTSGGSDAASAHIAKLLKEKQNVSKRNAELEAELKASKDNQLENNQKYEQLWQNEKEARLKVEGQHSQLRDKLEADKKRSAVKTELIKLGLNPKHEDTAFRLMNISDVMVDTETGAILGADHAAKSFHDSFKDLGLFGRQTPGVSHDAPNATQHVGKPLGDLTKEEIVQRLKTLE